MPPLKGLWLIGERPSLLFSGQFLELWNYILINFWKGPEGAHFRYPVNFAHLWFLLYLTIFNIFTFFFMKFERPKLINSILTRSHLFGAVILTTLSLCTMSGTWTDKPFTLWPKVSLLFYYGIFYFYGWLLFESRDILDLHSQHKRKWKILSICGLIIIGTRVYYQVNLLSIFNVSPIILHAWMAIGTWLIIIGAVIYAESIVKKSSLVVNYLVKASYFLYLSHLPVVVAVQLFLYDVDMNWFMKFLTANIVTLILIIPLYHYLIRDKVVDHFLKGKKLF
ncbi:MAG: acyltransferase family protein [Halobacteriovoraceae bacterium]|nr:acyltransferase family protein [Halobacteriovoraceae bacterium]